MAKTIKLEGRIFVTFTIQALTGLHIGGTETGIEIGGVDKTVIRDPLTNMPYIPGSSLKGKMRSLLEKRRGLKQNQRIGQGYIHSCGAEKADNSKDDYAGCDICQVFGVPGERDFATPTRLFVRDVPLSKTSAKMLNETNRTDLPYTEVKTEVSIDRVTSAANPRQMERVPAGAEFGEGQMVYSLYSGDDCSLQKDQQRFRVLLEGLQLLEDDYLGGLGSRGSGRVCFRQINVCFRSAKEALSPCQTLGEFSTLADWMDGEAALNAKLAAALGS